MKKYLFVLILLLSALLVSYFCFKPKYNYSFSLSSITAALPQDSRWSVVELTESEKLKIKDILGLKYRYLGHGKQSFAFVSENDEYVIKFFNMHCFSTSWKDYIYRRDAYKKRRKFERLFNGYKIGYEELKKETGLIWVHLNPSTDLNQTIEITDHNHNQFFINGDNAFFVIQKKVVPLFDSLSDLYKGDRKNEAEQLLESFYQFIKLRLLKGYTDRDRIFKDNYGVADGQVIHFDLGYLHKKANCQKESGRDELDYYKNKIEAWKKENNY